MHPIRPSQHLLQRNFQVSDLTDARPSQTPSEQVKESEGATVTFRKADVCKQTGAEKFSNEKSQLKTGRARGVPHLDC